MALERDAARARALRVGMTIAAAIGLHNFAEGLAIGVSASTGEIGLATVLIVGFALHNATEGFGIVGPLGDIKPSWTWLAVAGLIGGGPTFLGSILGYNVTSEPLELAFYAFSGALATVGPLRFAEMDLSETKLVALSATVMAAITVVLPWPRLPRAAVNVLLIAMAGYITALAHASGAVHDAPTMSVTFVVALAICFLPVRTSVAEVVLIALLLAGGLYLLGTQEAYVQALRTLLLLSGLVVLCGLVLILRSTIAAREAAAGRRIFNEDLLDERATRKRLDLELAATARDGGRLSLVLIEVTG